MPPPEHTNRAYTASCARRHTLFLVFVELPSIVLPILLEVIRARGLFSVINFNMCVAVVLAFMLARLFVEGQLIPAFQLLVLT